MVYMQLILFYIANIAETNLPSLKKASLIGKIKCGN